jgi:S-DNA-T family DNA segregation ATPase FtsK/SpoIIIE
MSPAAGNSRKPSGNWGAKKPAKPGKAAAAAPGKPVQYELVGLGFIALGAILLFATRLHGMVPDTLLRATQWLFGEYGAWGVALALIFLGFLFLIHLAQVEVSLTSLGMGIIFLVAISMFQLHEEIPWDPAHFIDSPGGFIGAAIAGSLNSLLGPVAWVFLIFLGLVGLAIMTDVPLWMLFTAPFKGLYKLFAWAARPALIAMRAKREAALAAKVEALQARELARRNGPVDDDDEAPMAKPVPRRAAAAKPAPVETPHVVFEAITAPAPIHEPEPEPAPEPVVGVPSKDKPDQLAFEDAAVAPKDTRPYELPAMELLTQSPKSARSSVDDTQEKIAALESTLRNFGIEAKVVGVERGPRVTRFELVPPPGIRINRITNLADDIALSLSALDVRVEAPVPGKGVVGIEIPNKESVIVDLREVLESDTCRKSKSPLTFSLGRDIAGHPRVTDLARMPHLLIAGATNSGKSVCINSLIASILMRATPRQVKFLMVDPKRVELSLFQNIPHLIAPVAYDAKHAAGLLRWAIREMEERYEMFAEKGVRNIVGFNEQSRLELLEELPYIVIIIDELADLMMQAAAEFEASICRIAQLARATGIHLVVATQRPSVNVITGTIKANIPSRIAFAVASQVDSRTILDMNGAERLVGQGDMLFLPVDASKPTRIQGAYVSEKDINRVVEWVKAQGKPNFSDDIVAIEEEALSEELGEPTNDEPEDELYEKALDYVRTTKYASTSMLQRKFRIGYTRAARLMDLFEERGYVGPGQGSKPREVIFAPAASVVGTRPASDDDDADFADEDIFPDVRG